MRSFDFVAILLACITALRCCAQAVPVSASGGLRSDGPSLTPSSSPSGKPVCEGDRLMREQYPLRRSVADACKTCAEEKESCADLPCCKNKGLTCVFVGKSKICKKTCAEADDSCLSLPCCDGKGLNCLGDDKSKTCKPCVKGGQTCKTSAECCEHLLCDSGTSTCQECAERSQSCERRPCCTNLSCDGKSKKCEPCVKVGGTQCTSRACCPGLSCISDKCCAPAGVTCTSDSNCCGSLTCLTTPEKTKVCGTFIPK